MPVAMVGEELEALPYGIPSMDMHSLILYPARARKCQPHGKFNLHPGLADHLGGKVAFESLPLRYCLISDRNCLLITIGELLSY